MIRADDVAICEAMGWTDIVARDCLVGAAAAWAVNGRAPAWALNALPHLGLELPRWNLCECIAVVALLPVSIKPIQKLSAAARVMGWRASMRAPGISVDSSGPHMGAALRALLLRAAREHPAELRALLP